MADSTPRPADFRVDPLSVVRAWLWRHSSQPNGDPWDGDPEHLDWAAQHLLDELVQQFFGGDPLIRAATQGRRDVASPAGVFSVTHAHPGSARRPATARSHPSTPASTA